MAVKDVKFRNAKPHDKAYKIPAERGLYMLVKANGSKCWRFKYRFLGKEKLLSICGFYAVLLWQKLMGNDVQNRGKISLPDFSNLDLPLVKCYNHKIRCNILILMIII